MLPTQQHCPSFMQTPAALLPSIAYAILIGSSDSHPQEIIHVLGEREKSLRLEELGKTCLELETSSHQISYKQHPHVCGASGGGQ